VSGRPSAKRLGVSVDSSAGAGQEHYPDLARALDRHLAWACDFATAGDLDSALDALRDAHAAAAELRASGEHSDG
jgi:hypothetical protein